MHACDIVMKHIVVAEAVSERPPKSRNLELPIIPDLKSFPCKVKSLALDLLDHQITCNEHITSVDTEDYKVSCRTWFSNHPVDREIMSGRKV